MFSESNRGSTLLETGRTPHTVIDQNLMDQTMSSLDKGTRGSVSTTIMTTIFSLESSLCFIVKGTSKLKRNRGSHYYGTEYSQSDFTTSFGKNIWDYFLGSLSFSFLYSFG
ncbi:uncharacterized protein LOC108221810 isoform X3 [Daucus carota subsp. sativus]|uniref:uncharacterized protein LOC108221810 isoform X3 n=1 Tax=Daucus carota subsp. sativus TaxID=79200 RepID=UPI003082916E